jgi:uncharacterized protein (DUF1778 family)
MAKLPASDMSEPIIVPQSIHLSPEAQKYFVEALLSPPEPGDALKRAFVLNDQLLWDE